MTPPERPELGRLREARGLTQQQLAAAAGLSIRTVRNLERDGMVRPHAQTVQLLATALDLDVDRLRQLLRPPEQVAAVPPLGPGSLVGREEDVRRLDGAVKQADLVVVTGQGGVGKTALVLEWAEQVAGGFPDGVVFVDLHGFDHDGTPATPADALRQLLLGFGARPDALPEDVDGLLGRYRALSAQRDVLLILDNARSSGQVRPLLPAGRGSKTLVTSRRRLDGLVAGDAAQLLPLDPLDEDDAVRLLRERGSDAATTEHLTMLARACAGLPLALLIVAAQVQRKPERVLHAPWQAVGSAELDLLEVEDGDRSIRRVVASTLDLLPARARGAAILLGLWPRVGLDQHAAAALLGESPAEAVRLLDSLADLHLVEEQEPGRYALHDLVAAYLAERAAELPAEARAAALDRTYHYHLVVFDRCGRILFPHRDLVRVVADDGDDLPWLRTPEDVARYHEHSRSATIAVIRQAQRMALAPYAWLLAYTATALFERRGPRSAWVELMERAVALVPDDDPVRPRLLSHLGLAHAMSGRLARSRGYWRTALELVPPDSANAATYLTNLANADCELGDYAAAMAGYERAAAVRQGLGDRLAVAYTLANVGRLRAATGDLDRARADLEEALRIGRDEGDDAVTGTCQLELGLVASARGDGAGAAELFRGAVHQGELIADDLLEAEARQRLGEVLPAGSEEATAQLRVAHRLYTGLEDARAEQVAARLGAALDVSA